jgi:hypothetical protein
MNVGVMKDYKLRDLRASHTVVLLFVFIFTFFFLNVLGMSQKDGGGQDEAEENEKDEVLFCPSNS